MEGFLPDDFSDSDIGPDIPQLGPYDVICGRCSVAFNYIGNRRFRATIGCNVQRYIEAPTRDHKSHVIASVMDILQNDMGAKFYKLKDGNYVELTSKTIRQKVGHALRDTAAQKMFGSTSGNGKRLSFDSSESNSSSGCSRKRQRREKTSIEDSSEMVADASEDHMISDDLSIEEGFSVSSAEIFPDAVIVSPDERPPTPQLATECEQRRAMFGKMVFEIDDLGILLNFDEEADDSSDEFSFDEKQFVDA